MQAGFLEQTTFLSYGNDVKLLELDGGNVSLELEPAEVQLAVERLRRFGAVRREPQATYDLIWVGEARLAFHDEWDEPCLLSLDPPGAVLLRTVAQSGQGQVSAPA